MLKQYIKRHVVLSLIAFSLCTFAAVSTATSQTEAFYNAGVVIGDGKDGRVWKNWQQAITDKPVHQIQIRLRRSSGSKETYVNLRFVGGEAFENGKRFNLIDNAERVLRWNVNGVKPAGKELLLNAYKGEVYVVSATVKYAPKSISTITPVTTTPPTINPIIPDTQPGSTTANNITPSHDDAYFVRRCKYEGNRLPTIELDELRPSGGLFSRKYRAYGSIFASCVQEAGYYENGKLVNKIEFPKSLTSQRIEFSFQIRSGKRGQVKVYTIDGRTSKIDLDEVIKGL